MSTARPVATVAETTSSEPQERFSPGLAPPVPPEGQTCLAPPPAACPAHPCPAARGRGVLVWASEFCLPPRPALGVKAQTSSADLPLASSPRWHWSQIPPGQDLDYVRVHLQETRTLHRATPSLGLHPSGVPGASYRVNCSPGRPAERKEVLLGAPPPSPELHVLT